MFTHYVMHDENVLAWSSCHCRAAKNHFVGAEIWVQEIDIPTPPPSTGTDFLRGVRMSDIATKRSAIRNLYGPAWKAKVDSMPDNQVIALFLKFQKEGKIK